MFMMLLEMFINILLNFGVIYSMLWVASWLVGPLPPETFKLVFTSIWILSVFLINLHVKEEN